MDLIVTETSKIRDKSTGHSVTVGSKRHQSGLHVVQNFHMETSEHHISPIKIEDNDDEEFANARKYFQGKLRVKKPLTSRGSFSKQAGMQGTGTFSIT